MNLDLDTYVVGGGKHRTTSGISRLCSGAEGISNTSFSEHPPS